MLIMLETEGIGSESFDATLKAGKMNEMSVLVISLHESRNIL